MLTVSQEQFLHKEYNHPERKRISTSLNVWQTGVMLHEIITGHPPDLETSMITSLGNEEPNFRTFARHDLLGEYRQYSKKLIRLLFLMLAHESRFRPTAEEIFSATTIAIGHFNGLNQAYAVEMYPGWGRGDEKGTFGKQDMLVKLVEKWRLAGKASSTWGSLALETEGKNEMIFPAQAGWQKLNKENWPWRQHVV